MRALRKTIRELLTAGDLSSVLKLPEQKTVSHIIAHFYDPNDHIRYNAFAALGMVTASLADKNMESARVVFRRLMWTLNDESGGIGWGAPEAMGEILARHAKIADEFTNIFISYMNPDGNYLEHDILQRGLLWGVSTFSSARPEKAAIAAPFLIAYLNSTDPLIRGLAAVIYSNIEKYVADDGLKCKIKVLLKTLKNDTSVINIYKDGGQKPYVVAMLAEKAMKSSGLL